MKPLLNTTILFLLVIGFSGGVSGQNIVTRNYPNGDVYVGEFRDGLRNGRGTYTHANGAVYVGEFRDGYLNGQGTLTFPDGDVYVGEFRDGQRNGQGAYTFADGRVDNGIWNNGEFVSADNIATRCFESDFLDC